MSDWTDAEEFSGRTAFDMWRFTRAQTAVAWDWADMARREKRQWIDHAKETEKAA